MLFLKNEIINNSNLDEDYDFILVFGDEIINEKGFTIDDIQGKKAPKQIRIRNNMEAHDDKMRKNGEFYSIKVSIGPQGNDKKKNNLIPFQYDPKTGKVYSEPKKNGNNPLKELGKDETKIINYMQNFVNDNLPYLNTYFENTDEDILNDMERKIKANSKGKKYSKGHFEVREE